ncbi:MAG: VWA domain-containing protein [Candidatus Methanomethylophilaceae archaeon]|jgi:magnesium chelatase subunit D
MSERVLSLPFSAIIGLESAKKALLCMAVDDTIKSILIKGPPGTAKSVLVRSFFGLTSEKKLINVPPSITDDQLFGGLDFETAIKDGHAIASGGLLSKADGNVAYVDNVNLMEGKILDMLLESVDTGRIIVEREGVSAEFSVNTSAVATMDPAERELPDSVADRFDICVTILPETDSDARAEIISSNIQFEEDPESVISQYFSEDRNVIESVRQARKILPSVILTEDDVNAIVKICQSLNVRGYRGDISTAKTARALAALDGETQVSEDHIAEALVLCLSHRRGALQVVEDEIVIKVKIDAEEDEEPIYIEPEEDEEPIPLPEDDDDEERDEENLLNALLPDEGKGTGQESTPEGLRFSYIYEKTKDLLEEIDEIEMLRLHEIAGIKHKRAMISRRNTGRYRGFRIPKGKTADPAFDATIRAAAPYQAGRDSKGLSINIEKQDIREKVRAMRNSSSFIFAVDTSGSLVDSGMLGPIQNAIRSMLMESYVKRDRVALITFRERDAEVTVPFTRSVETICDVLEQAPAGGSTPLAKAVVLAKDYATNYLRKHPGEKCYVIFITDGHATMPIYSCSNAMWELENICATVKDPNIEWTIIDSSETKFGKRDTYAKSFAEFIEGRYIDLHELDQY